MLSKVLSRHKTSEIRMQSTIWWIHCRNPVITETPQEATTKLNFIKKSTKFVFLVVVVVALLAVVVEEVGAWGAGGDGFLTIPRLQNTILQNNFKDENGYTSQ